MANFRKAALVSAISMASAYYVELVDTRIGSGGSAYGDGSVNPGVQVPFGALRLGPDSTLFDAALGGDVWASFEHFGGYHYNDTHIRAFSHTHTVGAGVNDWGNVGVTMVRALSPDTIQNSTAAAKYVSAFSHANETAQPGYYAVTLETHSVYAELTASGTHSGAHRYTCIPASASASGGQGSNNSCILLIDVCHTSSLPGACKIANVTVESGQDSSGSPLFVISASVLNSGALSGRSSLGGVWVHWYGEAQVTGGGQAQGNGTYGLWANDVLYPAVSSGGPSTASNGGNLGAWVDFLGPATPSSTLAVTLRVGISFIDPVHARQNLYADQAVPSFHPLRMSQQGAAGGPWATDFPGLVTAAGATWEQWLSRTQVTPLSAAGDDYPVLRTFTAASYRSLLAPTTYSEWDGAYLGMDQHVHAILYANGSTAGVGNTSAAPLYRYMSDMSLWDTHRTQGPWLSMVAPEVAADTVRSLLTMTGQGGHLPRWPMANVYTECMDGSHGIAVMADAYLKCTPGVSTACPEGSSLLHAIYDVTYTAVEVQASGNRYAALGYVPEEDSDTAASTTLEYAFDDGIAALVANATGNVTQAAAWAARSKNYGNVWDFNASTVCPRKADGTFNCPVSKWIPYPISSGYTEGNGAQWQWSVPHDLAGLLAHVYKGNGTAYSVDLHQLMTDQLLWPFVAAGVSDVLPNFAYWAGNEPDILAPWEFNAAGPTFAWLTQFWTRWLVRFYYIASPDGVPGNDDYGTLSAWAAWAMLGIYPLAGTGSWLLGSPSVMNASIGLPGAPALVIQVHNATDAGTGAANRFVSSASINGRLLSSPLVTFADLMPSRAAACGTAPPGAGTGLLEFTMTDSPTEWGTGRVLSPAELAPFPLPAWPAGVPTRPYSSGQASGSTLQHMCQHAKEVLGPVAGVAPLCGAHAARHSMAEHLRRKLRPRR